MISENEPTRLTQLDVLELPTDTGAVDARAAEIATNFVNEHAVRLELAAICLWRRNGSISGPEVYDLAAKSCMTSLQSDDEFLVQPVYAASLSVWSNLRKLAASEPVTFEQEPQSEDPDNYSAEADAYEAWRERQRERAMAWFKTVMNDLDRLLSMDRLYSSEIDDFVPHELKQHMSHETMRQIFDGLFGTGASLHFNGTGSLGGLGHRPETAVYLADAMARALMHSLQDLEGVSEDDKPFITSGIELWWGLLKGFIYSGAHSKVNCYDFAALLLGQPEVKNRIVRSLQAGIVELTRQEISDGLWGGGNTALTGTIAKTTTSQVIDDLLGAIEEAESFANAARYLR